MHFLHKGSDKNRIIMFKKLENFFISSCVLDKEKRKAILLFKSVVFMQQSLVSNVSFSQEKLRQEIFVMNFYLQSFRNCFSYYNIHEVFVQKNIFVKLPGIKECQDLHS